MPRIPLKTSARHACTVTTLVVLVFLTGCEAPRTTRSYRTVPLSDFTVVSSSSNRKLSSAELDQLQAGVERFLASQGLARSGDYLVRIDFAPTAPGEPADWVLVKLSSLPTADLSLAATYPTVSSVDYAYPYAYGFPPNGYDDDFGFYYAGDYHWASPPRPHHDDDHRPGGYPPGNSHGPTGNHAGGDYRDQHHDGPGPQGGGPTGHDHPKHTAGTTPHAPDPGGHPGPRAGTPPPNHTPSPAPTPAPAPKQVASKDSNDRDNRYK